MTRLRFSKSLCWLALAAVGCSDTPQQTVPFTFNRPERVEFVCLDPAGSSAKPEDSGDDADAGAQSAPLILPLRCCATKTPLNPTLFFDKDDPTKGERAEVCNGGTPTLHALVTQSTRGEVAAVDLDARKVLDSDPLIPGYTFVDVGGLPRAIVTPPHMPGNENLGPPWTYVAGAEEQSLRAVATCRFREGAGCGPEQGRQPNEMVIALPAQPSDMLFGPDNALWLTLPSVGALARVPLPTTGEAPFVTTGEAPLVSNDIKFFELPVVPDREPAEPVKEATEYVSACGLGYLLSLDESEVAMPLTVSAKGLGVSSPTRLRFDAESGLLLVADAKQPFIHVFSLEDGRVQVRGQIATGAPIRDFALTAAVPESADMPLEFATPDPEQKNPPKDPLPTFRPDEKRYLYAIDDRDGSVMVQSFEVANGVITATPLRAPSSFSRRDRLALTEAATAIDVVDNRALSGGLVCDWDRDAEIDDEADNTEEERAERSILDNAGSNTLRGVFLAVTTLAGRLEVFDVHDLDLYCRGEESCASNEELIADNNEAAAVAVRRHARRLLSIADRELTASDPDLFETLTCGAGRYETAKDTSPAPASDDGDPGMDAVDGGTGMEAGDAGAEPPPAPPTDTDPMSSETAQLCVAQDPWLQTNAQFYGEWESALARGWRGQLTLDKDSKTTGILTGPPGFDICARGILGAGLEPGYEGDQVVITGGPPSYAPADCQVPEEGSEPYLTITKSFADRLEVSVGGDKTNAQTLEKLVRCYPDVIRFDVRAKNAYVIVPRGVPPAPHRIKSDAGGACVVDPDKDARLISRAREGETFSNAFVSFRLPKAIAGEKKSRDSLIQMQGSGANNPFSVSVYLGAAENNPSLPVSVRYLSLTGDLYVVDTAQGLRRFALTPFAADTMPFR